MTSKSATSEGEDVVAATAAVIQKATDEAEEKGYYGKTVDETPRENYTVAGVTSGKPTPETPEAK